MLGILVQVWAVTARAEVPFAVCGIQRVIQLLRETCSEVSSGLPHKGLDSVVLRMSSGVIRDAQRCPDIHARLMDGKIIKTGNGLGWKGS